MKGHHASSEQEFSLNKSNNYLLPVNLVMPGGWEVNITIKEDNTILYEGRVLFDV